MKRARNIAKNSFAVLLCIAWELIAFGQENQGHGVGLVDDWTTHHVIFSNPGTEEDAIRNGTYEAWHASSLIRVIACSG